jgi:triosephosphate isomerase
MKSLIIANWKMNPQSFQEAKRLFNAVGKGIGDIQKTCLERNLMAEVVICPPFIYLLSLKSAGREADSREGRVLSIIKLGAQNLFWEKGGAYTGEISPFMLKDAGCEYVIIGHSERRRYFKETDEDINKKVKAALKAGLNPILCVGETEKERKKGNIRNILRKQIKSALEGVPSSPAFSGIQVPRFSIAYEPIWAIGSGKPCDAEEAKKNSALMRKIISEIYGPKTAGKIRLLYGGSVNSKNAESYIKEAGLNGLLIGGASLKAKEFIKIIGSVI